MYKTSLEHLIELESKEYYQRLLQLCQKESGANLKKLPLVQDGTNWTSIRINFNGLKQIKYVKIYKFIIMLKKKKTSLIPSGRCQGTKLFWKYVNKGIKGKNQIFILPFLCKSNLRVTKELIRKVFLFWSIPTNKWRKNEI